MPDLHKYRSPFFDAQRARNKAPDTGKSFTEYLVDKFEQGFSSTHHKMLASSLGDLVHFNSYVHQNFDTKFGVAILGARASEEVGVVNSFNMNGSEHLTYYVEVLPDGERMLWRTFFRRTHTPSKRKRNSPISDQKKSLARFARRRAWPSR